MIKEKNLELPLIQGGMGIGVSLGNLAGHVAKAGGMGVISAANPGYGEADFWERPAEANRRALEREIKKAKEIAGGRGLVAVNAMVATAEYQAAVETAISAGCDAIISGAGLPAALPGFRGADKAALAPIVSSPKAARTILRLWDKRFGRQPDFLVLEGSRAGGHLGFRREELISGGAKSLEDLLGEVLAEVSAFGERAGRAIPVFCGGGVFDGHDLARLTRAGAAGAQMATRFIATEECDAARGYKEAIVRAKAGDAVIVSSPVGMPGRALRSPLIERVGAGREIAGGRCIRCLVPCQPGAAPYCISRALIAAVRGDWREGLFFCGDNVGRVDRIRPVAELIREIMEEWRRDQ